jgi:hypothetical protein
MAEPITLEFLSKQLDRILGQAQAMQEELHETRAITQRCIAKARDVQDLLDELKAVLDEALCA